MKSQHHSTPAFVRSDLTSVLISALEDAKPGELLTYESLTEAAGSDVRHGKAYRALTSARNILRREKSKHFRTESKEGVRLMDSEGAVGCADGHRRVNRLAKRQLEIIKCAEYGELTDQKKLEHCAKSSLFGMLEFSSREKTLRRLQDKAEAMELKLDQAAVIRELDRAIAASEAKFDRSES